MCRIVAELHHIPGLQHNVKVQNVRTRAVRREAKLRWLAGEAEKERQRLAAEAVAQRKARMHEILQLLPQDATNVHVDVAYEAHLHAAVQELQKLAMMHRPASAEKLASLLRRRGCCRMRVGVPCHEVAAMMLPWLGCLPEADSLSRMVVPFAAISADSDMHLAHCAAGRALTQIVTRSLSFSCKEEFVQWLNTFSWAFVVVQSDVLTQELLRRGMVRDVPAGRLEYCDENMISVPPSQSQMAKDADIHYVSVHLGPGKVSGVSATLLRMTGLEVLASRWKASAWNDERVFVKYLEPTIEFLNGLTLKLKVHVLGGPGHVRSCLTELQKYVETDIAENWSPPSFMCERIDGKKLDAKDVGRIVGRGGANITRVELSHNLCLQVVKELTGEYLIKGWTLPGYAHLKYRHYTKNEDPSDIIRKLRVDVGSKRKEIELYIRKILHNARHSRMSSVASDNDACVESDIDPKSKLLRSVRRDRHLMFKIRRSPDVVGTTRNHAGTTPKVKVLQRKNKGLCSSGRHRNHQEPRRNHAFLKEALGKSYFQACLALAFLG